MDLETMSVSRCGLLKLSRLRARNDVKKSFLKVSIDWRKCLIIAIIAGCLLISQNKWDQLNGIFVTKLIVFFTPYLGEICRYGSIAIEHVSDHSGLLFAVVVNKRMHWYYSSQEKKGYNTFDSPETSIFWWSLLNVSWIIGDTNHQVKKRDPRIATSLLIWSQRKLKIGDCLVHVVV